MTAWELAEGAFFCSFFSLWLGFAICMVSLMVHIGSSGFFSTLSYGKRNEAFVQGMARTGSFFRSGRTGKIANVILAFGTIAILLAGTLAIYALATQPPAS